jgi:putative endonuclease
MRADRKFFVYILASKPYGTLYTGVTSDLQARVYQHKNGLFGGFTKKYGVKTLVYFEEIGTALDAIHREKRIKKWPRAWKINLIRTDNPDWDDLAADWYPEMPTKEEIKAWSMRIASIGDTDELHAAAKMGHPDRSQKSERPGDDGQEF